MGPGAALTALPKSKAGISASTSEPNSATATAHGKEPLRHKGTEPDPQQHDNTNFVHPDHDTPALKYNKGIDTLIVVCCHAIFHPDADAADFPTHSPQDENNWHLAPFQKSNPETGKPGEHETFLAHIQAGLDGMTTGTNAMWKEDVAWNQDKTLLIFSGGPTKPSLTSTSEARSYYHAALAQELAQGHIGGGRAHELYSKGRILLEERATDSFQNLLLSILLFRSTVGAYPKNVRIITHAFKAKRFLELHAPAIRWPQERIQVQGIDPVMSSAELKDTLRGEETVGYAPWKLDPFGTKEVLKGKRKQRGWEDSVTEELSENCEGSVKELLGGVDPSVLLPWERMGARTVEISTGSPPLRYG
jgi:hypothetical protein